MSIQKTVSFNCPPARLWEIVGTPERADWVPGVTDVSFDGDVRSLNLPGAGQIKERILARDETALTMSYSCIESPTPLDQHLAKIEVVPTDSGCEMRWQTEVTPVAFEKFIEQSMDQAIERLREMLA
jgi:carbon monoxide dehydrogenase subunit G